MRGSSAGHWLLLFASWLFVGMHQGFGVDPARAEETPLTPNVPIDQFQNRAEDSRPYDYDAPPQGMFLQIATAQGIDEELGFRRTHEIVPVNATDHFAPEAPAVFIVFQLHQHYQGFKVFGLCYPETVHGADPATLVTQDTMQIALEDETGYLRLPSPAGGWKEGRYKVEIHVGEQISEISLMGTLRFTIAAAAHAGGTPPTGRP